MANDLLADAPPAAAGRAATGSAAAGSAAARPPAPATGFRSAFRLDGDRLVLLDQRRLPDELVEVTRESAGDVAQAIRDMVVRGAPALGQVAAIGLALGAGRPQDETVRPPGHPARLGERPGERPADGRHDPLGHEPDAGPLRRRRELNEDGPAIAAALRDEAEAIVGEATMDHAALARLGAELLPRRTGDRSASSPTATPGRSPAARSARHWG